jgi:predicted transcriptional regulator
VTWADDDDDAIYPLTSELDIDDGPVREQLRQAVNRAAIMDEIADLGLALATLGSALRHAVSEENADDIERITSETHLTGIRIWQLTAKIY